MSAFERTLKQHIVSHRMDPKVVADFRKSANRLSVCRRVEAVGQPTLFFCVYFSCSQDRPTFRTRPLTRTGRFIEQWTGRQSGGGGTAALQLSRTSLA